MDVRSDFPILFRKVNGKPITYLDSACMSLRPKSVIDALTKYYTDYGGCAGRSVHTFATETTQKYQAARRSIAKLINASKDEIVFTKNTTEAINLLSHSLNLSSGDIVLTTDIEHNSNLIPWQQLKSKGVVSKVCPTNKGELDMNAFEEILSKGVSVVSFVHTSNVFGSTIDAKKLAKMAHDAGAIFILDAAQSVPHMPIDVKDIDADYVCFSVHKMCGPTGVGVLYGKGELLENLPPFMTGGDTVSDSTYTDATFQKVPQRFEAGLQNFAGIIGGGAAAEYLMKNGLENIYSHCKKLSLYMTKELSNISHVNLISSPKSSSLSTFTIDNISSHDVAMVLSETENIFVRSGAHCCHSWFNAHNIPATVRASLYFYNTREDVNKLVETVSKLASDFN